MQNILVAIDFLSRDYAKHFQTIPITIDLFSNYLNKSLQSTVSINIVNSLFQVIDS